ncbi:DUF4129 domain-containing protein [Neobacillus soli]|uniref:DUF4129 domain-containing protein n=1 Tax=Neobacillus soli TaxID=220688 RepID=UPI000824C268
MLDPNKARDILKEILNTHEYKVYQTDSKGLIETLWDKAINWIGRLLAKLFPSIETASSAAKPILIAIIITVILLLALSLFLIIRNHRRNQIRSNKKPLHSLKEINWTSQRHLAEAGKLEALEEFTASTRHLFLALLMHFHEKEWLEARIWKTNWDYYEELQRVNQQWAEEFYGFAAFFDEVTYGERSVQKEEYLQFRVEAIKWLGKTEERGMEIT